MRNAADVMFVIETSAYTSSCLETIKVKYIAPIMQYFFGFSVNDDIGLLNDVGIPA
jgi:hypothetical protein